MMGPTGVGKTEIARRLSHLARAPFIKVEATKFTEVGYVGREVDSIVRDLTDTAVKMVRETEMDRVRHRARENAERRVLDALMRLAASAGPASRLPVSGDERELKAALRRGDLDGEEVEMELQLAPVGVEIMAPPGMEEMTSQLQNMFQSLGNQRTRTRKLKVKDAMRLLTEEAAAAMVDQEELKSQALEAVEQNGIVFIDEMDKVCRRAEALGADVSREGVQRDLLPLVEGCAVTTKYGVVRTDHILFIASGAFQAVKPSDLIPELQGRFPIRVELGALGIEEFERILTEPDASLTEQYTALLGTEQVSLSFEAEAVHRIAEIACSVNDSTENIGARRLQTVLERLLESISFDAADRGGQTLKVDAAYVDEHLGKLAEDEDFRRYIL